MPSGPSYIASLASSSLAGTLCSRACAAEADHRVLSFNKSAQRRALEHARLTELQEAWERRDFATTWKLTRILTIRPKIKFERFRVFYGIT